MRKKYLSVLIIILVTLLLIVAVMYWYNRKIETIERKMREEPARKIQASTGKTIQAKKNTATISSCCWSSLSSS